MVAASKRLRLPIVFGGLAAALTLSFASAAEVPGLGPRVKVRFVLDVKTKFAYLLTDSTRAQRRWMRRHYTEMRGYPPYHDGTGALRWGPPTDFYDDMYASLRTDPLDRSVRRRHPNWILRDTHGNPLFIPVDCTGESCAAYAADPGSPGWRAWWIRQARQTLAAGYAGIYIDNVNMEKKVSGGDGQARRPIDPRTGTTMTPRDWRRYVARFCELIRARFPGVEITHNAGQWWIWQGDPEFNREVQAADRIELERGFSQGLDPGDGKFGFDTYLGYIDWLHGLGKSIVVQSYAVDAPTSLFDLASYLLVDAGDDQIASDFRAEPRNWWPLWDTDLGLALGDRYSWEGIWRRDFERGTVYVDPPGGPSISIDLLPGETANGRPETRRIDLGPSQGAIVTRRG
jgi:hypothetical protein